MSLYLIICVILVIPVYQLINVSYFRDKRIHSTTKHKTRKLTIWCKKKKDAFTEVSINKAVILSFADPELRNSNTEENVHTLERNIFWTPSIWIARKASITEKGLMWIFGSLMIDFSHFKLRPVVSEQLEFWRKMKSNQ